MVLYNIPAHNCIRVAQGGAATVAERRCVDVLFSWEHIREWPISLAALFHASVLRALGANALQRGTRCTARGISRARQPCHACVAYITGISAHDLTFKAK